VEPSVNVCGNAWYAIQGADETEVALVRDAQANGLVVDVWATGECDDFGIEPMVVITVRTLE
jgi:hypothetical protein